MSVEKIYAEIAEQIKTMPLENIIELWNYVFPDVKKLKKSDFKKMNDIDSNIVFEDTKMLILDAISEFNFKKLCRVYKKVCNKNYLVED
jgi:hypothetical protein